MLLQAAKPWVLFIALAFTTVTLLGCNSAPPPSGSAETKSGEKAAKKPVKPKKGPANVTS